MDKNSEIAIHVEGVYKNFRLPHEKSSTIKSAFVNILKGKRNRSTTVQHALKNISFDIKKGEFFGIVGRNGSGKSTLLKILAGIYQPTQGTVVTQGKLVPFIELGVGFNPELSGRDNVYLNGSLLGFSKEEIDSMYEKIVEFAELEQFMDQKLKNYSSGMQVRLAFSMAVRADADILLVDEVLAVGDADFQRKCFDYFRKLKKRKQTVVFVSHDMSAVREYCDRALLISDGVIKNMGRTEDVASEYTKLFLDTKEGDSGDDADSTRWGSNPTVFDDVKVNFVNGAIIASGRMKFQDDITAPLYGFSVKDAIGNPIMGTNTKLISKKTASHKAGSTTSFAWEFEDVLSDGEYTLDLTVLNAETLEPIDWWDGAKRFTVKKSVFSPYPITTKVDFRIGSN
ncbi:MAG: ABC transporter ATP-binding protein [Candidatus Saccharibacteria bacterium]